MKNFVKRVFPFLVVLVVGAIGLQISGLLTRSEGSVRDGLRSGMAVGSLLRSRSDNEQFEIGEGYIFFINRVSDLLDE